jgi:hypothetical protein
MENSELYHLLMSQVETQEDYGCRKLSDRVYYFFANDGGLHYMVNTDTKQVHEVTNGSRIIAFTHEDIDFDVVSKMEHNQSAYDMEARYGGLSIEDFHDGVSLVEWTLYPDGEYFADEDGYGMEDNPEINIDAYIDENCRVLIPFTDMKYEATKQRYKEEAIRLLKKIDK